MQEKNAHRTAQNLILEAYKDFHKGRLGRVSWPLASSRAAKSTVHSHKVHCASHRDYEVSTVLLEFKELTQEWADFKSPWDFLATNFLVRLSPTKVETGRNS